MKYIGFILFTVMTNAARLAAIGGGGTNCSAPLERLFVGHDDGRPESTLSSEGTVSPSAEPTRTTVSAASR